VGDVRAETYLRLVAEQELRRVMPAYGPDAALWNLRRAGRILVAAGALDEELLDQISREVEAALTVRSRTRLNRHGIVRHVFWPVPGSGPPGPGPARGPAARPMRIVPLGQTLRLASERAPADLHFLSLAGTPAQATIAVVMRMHWPSDGSSAEEELTGAGYHHLAYDRLWLADERGARYPVTFGGEGGTVTWQGVVHLSPAPPPQARWLDLIADGTNRLIRLDLRRDTGAGGQAQETTGVTTEENLGISAAERLLTAEAEAILADAAAQSGPGGRQTPDPHPGEIAAALIQAGLIAADSPVLGRLAALCQRLGLGGPAIPAPAAEDLPARWASVIAQLPAGAADAEFFAPLATILPDVDGTRFALTGLSTAAGESFLHIAASGMPELDERFTPHWRPGFSWWVRDDQGWHVAAMAKPSARAAGEADFRLRLVPPLTTAPEAIEVQVSGGRSGVRAVVSLHTGAGKGGH